MNPDESSNLQGRVAEALRSPKNLGEMANADSVGTAGSADCGDMMRLWLKFREGADGNKVIEKATFQGFGCETALAVASVATELLAGKTVAQAREMGGVELAAPLGPLPPMKIHCATLVEEALRQALDGSSAPAARSPGDPGLVGEMAKREQLGASKIVFLKPNEGSST